MLLPLVLAPALAHIPHDLVRAFVAPANLSPDATWWALLESQAPQLWRSDDGGRHWNMVHGAHMGDQPTDAAMLPGGTLVLKGRANLWWTSDGATWLHEPLPGSATKLNNAGGAVVLGGADGVWVGVPGEGFEQVTGSQPRVVGEGRLAVVTAEGTVLYDGGDFEVSGVVDEIGSVPAGATAVHAAPDEVFVGTSAGAVWRWSGAAWEECGPLPLAGDEHATVVALAEHDGLLLAGTGLYSPYASIDGCASWVDITAPEESAWGAQGGAASDFEVVTNLYAAEGAVAWGGWAGAWIRRDGDWLGTELMPGDFMRSLAVANSPEVLPRVYTAGYGAGPHRTDDGGQSFHSGNANVSSCNTDTVDVDAVTPDITYAMVNTKAYVSHDAGATWFETSIADDQGSFAPDDNVSGEVWAARVTGGAARSTDAGVTWTTVGGPPGDIAEGLFVDYVRMADGSYCGGFSRPAGVFCGPDLDTPWTRAFGPEDDPLGVLIGIPPEAPTTLVFASGAHAYRMVPGSPAETTHTLDTDIFIRLAAADDGTLLAFTSAGYGLYSTDEGTTWVSSGAWVPAPVRGVGPRVPFADTDQVLVATLDGSFSIDGFRSGAPVVQRWAPIQRYDDKSSFIDSAGPCAAPVTREGAVLGMVSELSTGCSLTWTVRGSRVEVVGESAGAGRVELWADGEVVADWGAAATSGLATLAGVDLDDGWHDLVVVGVLGDGEYLDYVDVRHDGATWAPLGDEPGDTAGGGDTDGAPGAPSGADDCDGCGGNAVVLLLGLVPWRRRQKLAGAQGLEPRTCGFGIRCSTD